MTRFRLCSLAALPDTGALGVDFDDGTRVLPLVLLKRGDGVLGFLNSCPHTGVRLEWRADDFFDRAGQHLQCTTHGALFRPENGYCVAGPCRGQSLVPLDLAVAGDDVYLNEPSRLPGTARARRR